MPKLDVTATPRSACNFATSSHQTRYALQVLAELNTLQPTHIICVTGRTHGAGYNTIDYLDQGGAVVCRENINDNLYCVVDCLLLAS